MKKIAYYRLMVKRAPFPSPAAAVVVRPRPLQPQIKTDSKLLRELKQTRARVFELEARGPDFSDPILAEAHKKIRELEDRSHAPRTVKEYAKAFGYFEAWCQERDYSSVPATVDTIRLYLQELNSGPTQRCEKGKMPRSIGVSMAAIAYEHNLRGYVSPHRNPLVAKILKGIRNEKGLAPMQKAPTEVDLVLKLLKAIDNDVATFEPRCASGKGNGAEKQILGNRLQGKRDKALFLVAFNAAFRRSEITSLYFEQIEFVDDGVNIFVRGSKGDQAKKGEWMGVAYEENKKACPVKALQAWVKEGKIQYGPLFPSVSQWGELGGNLSGCDLARILKKRADQLGISETELSGHSFRTGFATSAYKAGVPLVDIARRMRHKDLDTTRGYIRKLQSFEDNPAKGLLSRKKPGA
jgi:integrase